MRHILIQDFFSLIVPDFRGNFCFAQFGLLPDFPHLIPNMWVLTVRDFTRAADIHYS